MPLLVRNYAKGHQNTDVSGTLHEGKKFEAYMKIYIHK